MAYWMSAAVSFVMREQDKDVMHDEHCIQLLCGDQFGKAAGRWRQLDPALRFIGPAIAQPSELVLHYGARGSRALEGEQVIHPVDRLAGGVGAVELHVGEGSGDGLALFLDLGGPRRLAASDRQPPDGLLGAFQDDLGSGELALNPVS